MTDTTSSDYVPGVLVVHPKMPLWGPGRVLAVDGTKVTVYFRDLPGDNPEDAVRTIDTRYVHLARSESQSEPFLDNLPPYASGKFPAASQEAGDVSGGNREVPLALPALL